MYFIAKYKCWGSSAFRNLISVMVIVLYSVRFCRFWDLGKRSFMCVYLFFFEGNVLSSLKSKRLGWDPEQKLPLKHRYVHIIYIYLNMTCQKYRFGGIKSNCCGKAYKAAFIHI